MPKFRKKPVVIEARIATQDNYKELEEWGGYNPASRLYNTIPIYRINPIGNNKNGKFVPIGYNIRTIDSVAFAEIGDWIIKGTQGEFYPCKPDIFKETYEPVEDGDA